MVTRDGLIALAAEAYAAQLRKRTWRRYGFEWARQLNCRGWEIPLGEDVSTTTVNGKEIGIRFGASLNLSLSGVELERAWKRAHELAGREMPS